MVFTGYSKETPKLKKKLRTDKDIIERRFMIERNLIEDIEQINNIMNYRNPTVFTKRDGYFSGSIFINIAISHFLEQLNKMEKSHGEQEVENFLLQNYKEITNRHDRKKFNMGKKYR